METIYYSSTETAKLIRQHLKMVFPTVKFSVRKTSGSAITVSFEGTRLLGEAVNKLVSKYRGCDFDGMTDSKNYLTHEVNGQKVSYGADFIFVYLTDVEAA
jgi:hypothetical protein